MSSITEDQKSAIISLLREGVLEREQIASQLGVPPNVVRSIKAHYTMGTYDKMASSVSESKTEDIIDAVEASFGLERDLQIALRANIQQLERGLEIADDGKEHQTDAGRIDILAKDKSGTVVVIELKAGTAKPEALTQLLSYMGTVDSEGQPVRGILIAGEFHPRVVYAARAIGTVQLIRYRFNFAFEAVAA
ncbi:endonuclease NucS domain-containing protein [Desulfonatronum sp. SC1]|uniref:endonuclease NucS domain-containing protein n=1 Tax=Desulfonatronum sp. SC1 TaxID=2109626 RepID=UPI000D3173C8|nr:endonuclease NucS domain-containing protein [Desulfonatronum sp. SC1]PTN36868.1 hypothetical protein C6366_08350 [Desulfonatronum sp. SC1]